MQYFNILGFGDFSGLAIQFVSSVYRTVARYYDYMIDALFKTNASVFTDIILKFVDIVYVLIGVFMIFRITVSLLHYLINPDSISDSSVGAERLMKNVILTFILLLIFYPTGLVYSVSTKIEELVIGKDDSEGLIVRIMRNNGVHFEPTCKTEGGRRIGASTSSSASSNTGYVPSQPTYGCNWSISSYVNEEMTITPDSSCACPSGWQRETQESTCHKKVTPISDATGDTIDMESVVPSGTKLNGCPSGYHQYNKLCVKCNSGYNYDKNTGTCTSTSGNRPQSNAIPQQNFFKPKFIEDVYAAKGDKNDPLVCYYGQFVKVRMNGIEDNTANGSCEPHVEIMKISFYREEPGCQYKYEGRASNGDTIYYCFETGKADFDFTYINKAGNEDTARYTFNYEYNVKYGGVKNENGVWTDQLAEFPTSCSRVNLQGVVTNESDPLQTSTYYKWSFVSSVNSSDKLAYTAYDSEGKLAKTIEDVGGQKITDCLEDVGTTDPKNATQCMTAGEYFANSLASNFFTCPLIDSVTGTKTDQEICDYTADIFTNHAHLQKALEDDKISLDFFVAIIVGIGVVIYLAFLSVIVIIRNLKLILLRILAPIAFVAGLDPKSKVRGEWFSMYISTYIEIFLYLFAIKLAAVFLQVDVIGQMEGFTKLFAILALLVFVRAVPSIISKLLGIDISGGTFKEIFGLAKKGVGMATGAALNTGANIARTVGNIALAKDKATAWGAFGRGVLGTVGGAFSGAAAGRGGYKAAKARADNTLQRANIERKAMADGVSLSEVAAEGLKKRFHIDTTVEKAKAKAEDDKTFISEMDAAKELMLKIAQKEIAFSNSEEGWAAHAAGDFVLAAEFAEWEKAKNAYQEALHTPGADVTAAESRLKKAEGAVFEKIMTDLHRDDGSGELMLATKHYGKLLDKNSRGEMVDLMKALAQVDRVEHTAEDIGISKRELYNEAMIDANGKLVKEYRYEKDKDGNVVKVEIKRNGRFQKDTKDVAEIDFMKQTQTIRDGSSAQKLAEMDNQ